MNIAAAIAEVVEDLAAAADVKQVHLSEATGIPRSTLQRRLSGQPFSVNELHAVATALGTTGSQILTDAERRRHE